MEKRSLLIGVLLGVGLGATLGVLYAPRPGKETRCQLAEAAGNLKEAVAEQKRKGLVILLAPITINYQPSTSVAPKQ